MKKVNVISASLLTVGLLLAVATNADALSARVKGQNTSFTVSKVEFTKTPFPELDGMVLKGPAIDKAQALHEKAKANTSGKLDLRSLVMKNAKVTIFDGNNKPYALQGFASDGTPLVVPMTSSGPARLGVAPTTKSGNL
jgi:hypothetical protein